MTIANLNIDWGSKQKSKSHIHKIEEALDALDFNILILTESVDLELPAYNFVYKTKALPQDQEYEDLHYAEYLNGASANRVSIYSKYQSSRSFKVSDDYTSICRQFETEIGIITIYATIIGTWFKKKKYAEKELFNCITDCLRISNKTNTLCLAGDLNTSFSSTEKHMQINDETTKLLKDLCNSCKLDLTTAKLENNIDHIFISKRLTRGLIVEPAVFVQKGELSDHQGIYLDIQKKYIS